MRRLTEDCHEGITQAEEARCYGSPSHKHMSYTPGDLKAALTEVSTSSAGGAPFLIAFGATFLACAVLSYFLPTRTAALIVMFQGSVALPFAFWLELRLGSKQMAPD